MIKRSLVVISIIVLAMVSTSYAGGGTWNGWIYQDPYPTSLNLFDVKFVTPNKGWITGKYGNIFYTEDGGDTWESQETGLEEDIMRVAFVNDKIGWAAGKQGSIIHTADGGKTWVKQYSANALLTKVFFIDEKEGWVTGATPQAIVLHTKDGGKTWNKVETGITRAISSVYFVNSQTGWILAGEDVYQTINGGKRWEKRAALPVGKMPGHVVGGGRFTNSGESGLGSEWWFGGIAFANEKQGWAAVSRWIFHTEDGGKTWSIQFDTGSMDRGLRHISFSDAQNGCASGWSIVCTEDGGKNWTERLGITIEYYDEALGGIDIIGRLAGWAVGNSGRILKTGDNGRTWKENKNECGSMMSFLNNNKTGWIYDPENSNTLCKTTDGGHTTEKKDIGMRVKNVFFMDDNNGWAVGLIDEWREGDEDHHRRYNRTNVWGIIKHTSDGGKTWTTQYKESLGEKYRPDLTAAYFVNPDTGWVVGAQGVILHTADGGKTWEHQKSGAGDYRLNGIYFINPKKGWITGMRSADNWTGIILYTEDGGKQWHVQRSQGGAAYKDIYFENNKIGWISGNSEHGEKGSLLHTVNGGKTWSEQGFEAIGENHMAFLDKERGVIYSLHAGSMVVTVDGGKTWSRKRVPLKKYSWHFSELFDRGL